MFPLQYILISKQPQITLLFFEPKMFVMSYCQMKSSFHPSLDLEKIGISRSFQQSAEEIYDLSHFKQERVAFFNRTTFHQLTDATLVVLAQNLFAWTIFCWTEIYGRYSKWLVFEYSKTKISWIKWHQKTNFH